MRALCHLREHRGRRTLREIAEASGVATAYLSQIETGRRLPTDAELHALTEAYGIDVERMYDWQPPQSLVIELDPKDEV